MYAKGSQRFQEKKAVFETAEQLINFCGTGKAIKQFFGPTSGGRDNRYC